MTPGASDKTSDPVRIYLREMSIVPLLSREGEVSIARRIDRGRARVLKTISRSPLCIEELLEIGERLRRGELHIREIVSFSEQEPLTEERIGEYQIATLESLDELKKSYARLLKFQDKLIDEPKKSAKLGRMRRAVGVARVQLSRQARQLDLVIQQIDHFTALIHVAALQAREARAAIDKARRALEKRRWNEDERELRRNLRDTERQLGEMEARWRMTALELERSLGAVIAGEQEANLAKQELIEAILRSRLQ